MTNENPYYIVMEEWNYPCESGRNFVKDYDTFDEAMNCARKRCEEEETNFCENVKEDCLPAESFGGPGEDSGFIVTTRMGLDDFYYRCIVIERMLL